MGSCMVSRLRRRIRRNMQRMMVHQVDKVDLHAYLREQYYLIYYSRNTKTFRLDEG